MMLLKRLGCSYLFQWRVPSRIPYGEKTNNADFLHWKWILTQLSFYQSNIFLLFFILAYVLHNNAGNMHSNREKR